MNHAYLLTPEVQTKSKFYTLPMYLLPERSLKALYFPGWTLKNLASSGIKRKERTAFLVDLPPLNV
jgi:hypothetical protein